MLRLNVRNTTKINSRQQNLLYLVKLLKMVKLAKFNNYNKKSNSYNIEKIAVNYNKQMLEMRSHYIDIFIENKKKEIENVRELMNINIKVENVDLEKEKEKVKVKEIEKKKMFIKKPAESLKNKSLVKIVTEQTLKEITGELVEEDFLNSTVDQIVKKVIEENDNIKLVDENVIHKLVKNKIQEESQINENSSYKQDETKLIKKKTLNELENITAKILVVIACHTNSNMRFNAISSIMKYLEEVDNIDIIVVNSANTHLSKFVQNAFKNKIFKYLEINNDNYYVFSKWQYGVKSVDITKYKFTTFINDSILVHYSLKHFFDYTRLADVDLYGYNNSTQINHHYQTYLFSIKNSNLQQFIKMINNNKSSIKTYFDAVSQYELKLLDYYPNRDCFLKIAYLPSQKGNNIFFNNDFLYIKLRDSGLLPFTKLKRIS